MAAVTLAVAGLALVTPVALAAAPTKLSFGPTSATTLSPAGSQVPAQALTSLGVSAVIKALASEGVGVYSSPTSKHPLAKIKAPVTPLRMLLSQAQADAAQISSGGGASGSDLDALVPMPANAPPFAYLMAAYANGHSTAGEILAGKLIGSAALTNPEAAVFPTLVQTLFAADAVRAEQKNRHERKHGRGGRKHRFARAATVPPARAVEARAVGTACATIASWTSSAVSKFFSALTVGTPSNKALGFLAGIWNSAVAQASAAISGIASTLTDQVTSIIRNGLGIVGVASMAVSTLQNLRLKITTAPTTNSFGVVPAAGNPGAVTATLGGPSGIDYPADLTECAKHVFDINLPSLNDVSGDTVSWTTQLNGVGGAALASVSNQQNTLGSNHAATLSYTTSVESADQAARGALITTDYLKVTATVTPSTFKNLLDLVDALTLGRLPGFVSKVVHPLVDALKAAVVSKITALVSPSDVRYIQVTHHSVPAALPARYCDGLLTEGQFPGANQPYTQSSTNVFPPGIVTSTCGAGYDDGGNKQSRDQPEGGGILLEVAPTSAVASQIFADDLRGAQVKGPVTYPLSGIGDDAFSANVTPAMSGGPTGESDVEARVANDVFLISFDAYENVPAQNPSGDASFVVSELCPLCKFPTTP